jgi:hypothetical protein
MGEALEEGHNWLRRISGWAAVLEVAQMQTWTSYILVVVLQGSGTSQSVQDCVAAAADAGEDCSTCCWTVSVVDLLCAKW